MLLMPALIAVTVKLKLAEPEAAIEVGFDPKAVMVNAPVLSDVAVTVTGTLAEPVFCTVTVRV